MRKPQETSRRQDPKSAELGQKLTALAPRMVELLFDKAAHHLEDPARFPLAPGSSPERRLVERLRGMSDRRRRRFDEKVRELCRPKDRNAHFGPLAGVDLASATPLATQIHERLTGYVPVLEGAAPQPTVGRGALPDI